jgi:serine/threonine protein kinase
VCSVSSVGNKGSSEKDDVIDGDPNGNVPLQPAPFFCLFAAFAAIRARMSLRTTLSASFSPHAHVCVLSVASSVLGPHHFRIGRVLGRGAFGKVIAVTKKDTKKNYAVKLLSKHHIMEKNAVKSVLNERKLLADLSNPFIVNLLYAYQTEQDLCMVVDLMYGGDVRFHLTKETYFDEERVKFYAASVVLGTRISAILLAC